MAHKLNGKVLRPGRPFVDANGIQYPGDWLYKTTQEEKEAIGIEIVPDPEPYNSRFYTGYDSDGNLVERDYVGIQSSYREEQDKTAYSLLASTDWYVTRKYEKDIDIPVGIASFRDAVRDVCESRKVLLDGATDLTSLVGIVTFAGLDWPQIDF